MKTIYHIYEASILGDIEDNITKSDESTKILAELADARKLKFEPGKKDRCSVMFDCPALLAKCLDLKVKHKIASKHLGIPTSVMLTYEYDAKRNYYDVQITVFSERKYVKYLYTASSWDYLNKEKSAEVANDIFEYMLKSEKHFKHMLSLFDVNSLKYDVINSFFRAPDFSAKALATSLKKL